jgi:hypothetical protein
MPKHETAEHTAQAKGRKQKAGIRKLDFRFSFFIPRLCTTRASVMNVLDVLIG